MAQYQSENYFAIDPGAETGEFHSGAFTLDR
jgi:hypothetical protein